MDYDELLDMVPASHTIIVEVATGSAAYGTILAPPVQVDRCIVQASRKRVRIQTQDAAGEEVLSTTSVICPPGSVVPPGSRVTLPSGIVSRVLTQADIDDLGLDLPAHVALALE